MIQYNAVGDFYEESERERLESMKRARLGYAGNTHIGPEGRVHDPDIAWTVAHAEAPHRNLALAAQARVTRHQRARDLGEGVFWVMGGEDTDLRFGPFLTDEQYQRATSEATAHYLEGHGAAAEAWRIAEESRD